VTNASPVVLVPVKDPAKGKQRLAGLFAPEERTALIWTMFRDVAQAIQDCPAVGRVVVVSRSSEVLQFAARRGWTVLEEEVQMSESRSVDWASRLLREEGVTAVLRLPIDLPLLQAADIESLLHSTIATPGALIVPSSDGNGTNAILRNPPDVFPSRFGPDSFRLHQEEAAMVGAAVSIVQNARIAVDLDTPSDIRDFLEVGSGTATFALLQDLRVHSRLKHGIL